ncbi:MAG: thioredoxin domain-containing protein [gamma proteobacterium symbiont of Bathyaustriella thionipta]|nr:thioredoxin domain-containing protein [gamma proteobacterium symbiont of Bathyaustriella thionipta]
MNHLKNATSPYLLQHADNPVNWWGWCEQSLQLAQQQDKPILLSIGYSACHWCHVMAHESFEDAATAALMNRLFINIKVDREQRPDLDRIYQNAHQLLANRPGGWPLTVFLTPDKQIPFFAGTYFPPQARHGLPAFADLLQHIHSAWQQQRSEIEQQNQSVMEALNSLQPQSPVAADALDSTPLDAVRQQLQQHFDARFGGFGDAPKFPHPGNIERLLQHLYRTRKNHHMDRQALHMALFTLEKMAAGGLQDQIGGGFFRYSVDAQWMIPHFEKMLYDNGPLLSLYCDAWLINKSPLFKRSIEACADWVMREMQSPEGAYYSSLDADSEGQEGLFYIWRKQQIQALLDKQSYALLQQIYGLQGKANFSGQWHLHSHKTVAQAAAKLGLTEAQAQEKLAAAGHKLLQAREQRTRPARDDKILVSWNALMIKGMLRAGQVLQRADYIESASRALDFIHKNMWSNGRLSASHKDGLSTLNAYLDDYACLLDALLFKLSIQWHTQDLLFAVQLADILLSQFEDPQQGGFFFTSHDHESLITRTKSMADDSLPSGNAVAALALQRLGLLLSDERYLQAARRTLQLAWSGMLQIPYAHCSLLNALDSWLHPPETLFVRGSPQAIQHLQTLAAQQWNPDRIVWMIENAVDDLPPALAHYKPQGDISAWRCSVQGCQPALTRREDIEALLQPENYSQ